MGRKKRTHAPNPTPPPPDAPRRPPAAGGGGAGPDDTAVRAEVDKALACLQRGSHARALRLMKDAVARHGEASSPLLLRAHGTVHARAASVLDDPAARARHQRAALQAAQRAVQLAPDSVELAHFHAMLLFDAATDARGYEDVVSECERGLSIDAPSDPAPHSLRLPGPDVDQVQSELRNLIQKANLASISTWVKTLGAAGDDKLRLIPVRRLADEPMEGRLVPTLPSPRRPNEIKKATKTPEERRQEIEVRLAAIRLLQQHKQQSNGAVEATPTSSQPQGDEAPSSSSSHSSVAGHRADRRRAGSRKATISSASDRMDQVRAYWAAIPLEQRLAFLNTSISELKSHYAAAMHKDKDLASAASEVLLNEVLGFADKSGKWEFWVCRRCREQFADAESYRFHVLRVHVGILSPELKDMVPQEIDADWASMLTGWNWRPLDATTALKLFEDEQADNLGLDNRDKDSMSSDNWSNKDKSDTSESSVSPHNEECDGFGVVLREGDRKSPCKHNPNKFEKDSKQGTLQAIQGEGISTWRFDQDALREAFAEMVVEDEMPFAFGEKPGFTKFMAKACPRFKLPSRRTCTRDTVRVYFQERAKLKKFFKDSCQRVCLTTDCWTSQQQDGYMTVTASFIDNNWQLHKKVISFFKVKGHKGEDIGKNLLKCMTDWGLDRVMTVTVDNASANDSGVAILRKQLQNTNIADGKYLHMRCAAHIINLIVQDGLKEVDVSVKRVRAAIRYVKNGTSRLVKFKEIVEEEKVDSKAFLKLDVPTRWNSTYLMLKSAIVYEKVFTRLVEDDYAFVIDLSEERDGPGHPDETDWDKAKKMAEFLEHFHDLTVRVSSSLHVTCNTFFNEIGEVHLLIQSWMNSNDRLQSSMGRRMKEKFDKYWGVWHINKGGEQEQDNEEREKEKRGRGKGKAKEKENINLLIFVAAVLDPRYKLSLYTKLTVEEIFGEEIGQLVWAAIKSCVRDLFEEYRKIHAPNEVQAEVNDLNQSNGGRQGMLAEKIAKRMRTESGSSSTTKSELDKYLNEETEDRDKKIDILVWWKDNANRLPILAHLARDVLAIPISTVASESAFSTSGRILDDFRTSLTPFMVEALVCAQDWLRRSTPIDIQENMEELEMMEKELIEEFGNHKAHNVGKGKGKEKVVTFKTPETPRSTSTQTGSNSKSLSKSATSTS